MDERLPSAGPGVIVVAEEPLADLLRDSGVEWRVQDRQTSVGAMWAGLSSGALDQRSRILVFSDSLLADTADDAGELQQTARALVAMSKAGAVVAIARWRPENWAQFEQLISAEAAAQGVSRDSLIFTVLPVQEGGEAVMEALRPAAEALATFPPSYPAAVAGWMKPVSEPEPLLPMDPEPVLPSLPQSIAETPAPIPTAAVPAPPAAPVPPAAPALKLGGNPPLPPTIEPVESNGVAPDSEYPPNASMELLNRPKLPGQTTITVTSSKGGSGKSTVSILLAATIAHNSAKAGKPLSVCVLDLDTRDGQVASLIGKFMPTALNIRVQPVWDEERIRRNMVSADGLGVDTLLAPIRPRTADTVGPDFYRTLVRSLQRMYDVVIMDTSVQYLEPLIAEVALREADAVLFVTTLAATAIQGMARALREITAPLDESGLGIPRSKVGIVVNQSVANVGMDRDQVLAAGLGVPVVGVIPLATKDVLTATNLNNMSALLAHPLLGPAYSELARACMPGKALADGPADADGLAGEPMVDGDLDEDGVVGAGRRKGLFKR